MDKQTPLMRYRYSAAQDGKLEKKAVIYTRDEHGINFADVDSEAVSIIKKLKSAGYESYVVGGAVRDLILGKKPKDFDIASSASPARIKKIFRNSRIIGQRFRLVHVYFGSRIFEVATFRSLSDGNSSNTFGTIDDDVQRRDFTLNALFYDPEQHIVVDYIGGMNDIKNKQIKPIIPLSNIFTDDPVRMIRAVKYAAVTGFSIPMNLKRKISSQSHLLSGISPSRLTEEIFKIVNSEKAAEIVDLLDKLKLFHYLQPQAALLMKKNPAFKTKYLQRMAELKGTENKRGKAIGSLYYDYLDTINNWKPGPIENYKEIYGLVRAFILPMNPPRFELQYSLKKYLVSHGIIVRRTSQSAPLAKIHDASSPKRKRRRRRSPKPEQQNLIQ